MANCFMFTPTVPNWTSIAFFTVPEGKFYQGNPGMRFIHVQTMSMKLTTGFTPFLKIAVIDMLQLFHVH